MLKIIYMASTGSLEMGHCFMSLRGFMMGRNLHLCSLSSFILYFFFFAPTIRVATPAFTRFHSKAYYTLLCQYLWSDYNLRPHYVDTLTQFAFIGSPWMACFTYPCSCKGNPKVRSVFITRRLVRFLLECHILGLTLIKHILDRYTDVFFLPFHLFFYFFSLAWHRMIMNAQGMFTPSRFHRTQSLHWLMCAYPMFSL